MAQRRSVRDFAGDPVPAGVVGAALPAPANAPSWAHRHPSVVLKTSTG
ncbi:nitroreductase family protein [Micromonospora sp. DT227]